MNNGIIHDIAPGKDHVASGVLYKKCEYLSFTELFCKRRFEHYYPRNINIYMFRYFNHTLINYTQRVLYMFYAQSVLQQINFHDQISIAMRRCHQ